MNSKRFLSLMTATLLAVVAAGEEATLLKEKTPMEVAQEFKMQLAVLNFDGLRAIMTRGEYADEFKEDEQELKEAKKSGEEVYQAKFQKELSEAKRDSDEMKLISETINGDRAIVKYEETDDNEINYMLFVKRDGKWLIMETDEDDFSDAERFLKVKKQRSNRRQHKKDND